jgi:hypothetical protein
MILIVDRDLGFLLWLGQSLAEAGYRVLPALSCAEAFSRGKTFGVTIDDVIVEQGLPGASEMLQKLARVNNSLRVIFIGNPAIHIPATIPADMTIQRPRSGEPLSPEKWLMTLETVLSSSPCKTLGCVTVPRS